MLFIFPNFKTTIEKITLSLCIIWGIYSNAIAAPASRSIITYEATSGKLPEKNSPRWKSRYYINGKSAMVGSDELSGNKVLILDHSPQTAPNKFANYSLNMPPVTAGANEVVTVEFRLRLVDKNIHVPQFTLGVARKMPDGAIKCWAIGIADDYIYCHMKKTVKEPIGNAWHTYKVVFDMKQEKATLYIDGKTKAVLTYPAYKSTKGASRIWFGDGSTKVVGKAALAFISIKETLHPSSYTRINNSVPKLTKPGVLLTFDDHSVNSWLKVRSLLKRYGARVTFFIDRWDQLSPQQIDKLKLLRSDGHAIGCHGLRHYPALSYMKKHSAEQYLNAEIIPAIKLMRASGFDPVCFAYPSSQHNANLDQILHKYFRHVRSGWGKAKGEKLADMGRIFTPLDKVGEKVCLTGTCVQPHSADSELITEVKAAFKRAQKRNEVLVFYAHDIRPKDAPGPRHYITPDALEQILKAVCDSGLNFYTFNDLP